MRRDALTNKNKTTNWRLRATTSKKRNENKYDTSNPIGSRWRMAAHAGRPRTGRRLRLLRTGQRQSRTRGSGRHRRGGRQQGSLSRLRGGRTNLHVEWFHVGGRRAQGHAVRRRRKR